MKNARLTKRLCRAGVIAALYVALSYAFMPFAFGPFQIRPAEALCILPLFFPEAVPALFIGCALTNISSPYAFYDVTFGALATLVAALGTFAIGKYCKKDFIKITLGGIFPVLVNAFVVPALIVFVAGDLGSNQTLIGAYFTYVCWIALSQSVFVYGLGTPLYYAMKKLPKDKL